MTRKILIAFALVLGTTAFAHASEIVEGVKQSSVDTIHAVKQAGGEIAEGAQKLGKQAVEGAQKLGSEAVDGLRKTGAEIKQAGQEIKGAITGDKKEPKGEGKE